MLDVGAVGGGGGDMCVRACVRAGVRACVVFVSFCRPDITVMADWA